MHNSKAREHYLELVRRPYAEAIQEAADRLEELSGYRQSDYNDYDPAPDRDLAARLHALTRQ